MDNDQKRSSYFNFSASIYGAFSNYWKCFWDFYYFPKKAFLILSLIIGLVKSICFLKVWACTSSLAFQLFLLLSKAFILVAHIHDSYLFHVSIESVLTWAPRINYNHVQMPLDVRDSSFCSLDCIDTDITVYLYLWVFMVLITPWKSPTLTLVKKAWILVNVFWLTVYNSANRYLFFVSMGYVLILTSNDNVTHWPLFLGNHSDLTFFFSWDLSAAII